MGNCRQLKADGLAEKVHRQDIAAGGNVEGEGRCEAQIAGVVEICLTCKHFDDPGSTKLQHTSNQTLDIY